jgi:hypothetical protein
MTPTTAEDESAVMMQEGRRGGGGMGEREEFIAVVFGNEVWMGIVDFKSDKPTSEDSGNSTPFEEDFGTLFLSPSLLSPSSP